MKELIIVIIQGKNILKKSSFAVYTLIYVWVYFKILFLFCALTYLHIIITGMWDFLNKFLEDFMHIRSTPK